MSEESDFNSLPDNVREFTRTVLSLSPGARVRDVAVKSLQFLDNSSVVDEFPLVHSTLASLSKQFDPGMLNDPSRWAGAQGLLVQLHGIAVSAWHLYEGISTPDGRTAFDPSGLASVARNALESAVAFNCVFVDSVGNAVEADLRYWLWELAGAKLFLDKDYPEHDAGIREARENARAKVAENAPKIREILHRRNLKESTIKSFIRDGNWNLGKRIDSYGTAFFGPVFARVIYSHLSSHIHADSLAAAQVLSIRSDPDRWPPFGDEMLRVVAVSMARSAVGAIRLAPAIVSPADIPVDAAIAVVYNSDLASYVPRGMTPQ